MKTPLPKKWEYEGQGHHTVNQIITYLAELTEVVEGKPCRHCEVAEQQGVTHIHTSTLKEQLLEEMFSASYRTHINSDLSVDLSHIEAIINRLIP